jgi:hypothetical protein
MKKLLLTGVAVLFLATGTAHAAGSTQLHHEVLGKWCSQTGFGPSGPDKREWFIQQEDCKSFDRLVVTYTELKGHEFGCKITSVKLVTDGNYVNAANTRMGAMINQFTADCQELYCSYSAKGTIFTSKGMLGLRLYRVSKEQCSE